MSYFSFQQKISLARSLLTKTSPSYVQYYVTARCNMACEQCNIIYADAAAPEMNINQIRQMAENMAKIGVCIVLLIGGEPFIRKDLPEIVKAFVDVGIHVRMQTNGLATRKQIEACLKSGAYDISVSIDSLHPNLQESINGGYLLSWHRAIETIAMINELFPENGTAFFNTVLMPRNINDISDVIEFATIIGWGMSIVPVHVTTNDSPRGYRTIINSEVVTFTEDKYHEVKVIIEKIKEMRRRGYNVYDSDEYLDDIYRFVSNQPLHWRRRNGNVCDSPNLYFAIAPNGNLKVCCDFELDNSYPVYHDNFVSWYHSGVIHEEVYKYTHSCNGCMYGSYPEITISARFLRPLLERSRYFISPPRLKKYTAEEMMAMAAGIVQKKTRRLQKK